MTIPSISGYSPPFQPPSDFLLLKSTVNRLISELQDLREQLTQNSNHKDPQLKSLLDSVNSGLETIITRGQDPKTGLSRKEQQLIQAISEIKPQLGSFSKENVSYIDEELEHLTSLNEQLGRS